jgi:undecaprenyl-diphosphatase
MSLIQVMVLAIIQGACELLPVSSSAHVIMAEKLMGINPSAPEMTLLLVTLHTGTMLAVIIYFWRSWKESFLASRAAFGNFAARAVVATLFTGVVGMALKVLIERVFLRGVEHAEVELLFGNLGLISLALAAVGVFIIVAGRGRKTEDGGRKTDLLFPSPAIRPPSSVLRYPLSVLRPPLSGRYAALIGAVQGLCLPFRGFSRSGATISTGLLLGLSKKDAEEFSFALVVILTPAIIIKEVHRLLAHHAAAGIGAAGHGLFQLFLPSIIGMCLSFLAGLLALKWLSNWLERGRWKYFGWYCLAASVVAYIIKN